MTAVFCMAFVSDITAQSPCIPTSVRPVFGTVNASSGTVTFTNMPTGNVIQINCASANTQYLIDGCGTNPGTVADGTNDGAISILTANSASATSLQYIDDGCTNVVPNGFGPPVGTWTAPSAGTFFLYLTEWDAGGTNNCVADGVNNAYDFAITITAPPSNDISLDSAYLPSLYTSIAVQQLTTPFNVGARVKNIGGAAASNVTVDVRIRNLTTATVVSTQTLTGPSSLASGASANVPGTAYSAPAVTAVYEFRYISHMTQTDANHLNDTAFRYVIVDTSLLAEDAAILFGTIDNVLGVNTVPAIMGQKYQFATATSIDTVFGYFVIPLANVGDSVQSVIYNTSGGQPTTIAASSPIHVFTVADTGGVMLPFVFNPNFSVSPGTYYIAMKQISAKNFGLAQTTENYIAGNAMYAVTPFTTWNLIEDAGFPGSFLIWVNTKLNCTLAASASPTGTTCGLSNGSAALNVTGANGTPSYTWSNGSSSSSLTNVAAGNYSVTVSAGGCSATASVVLSNTGTQPSISLTPTAASCGSTNGSVSTSVNGGGGPYTYSWSNSAGNVSSISNLAAGSYSVTVSDGTCSASSTTFVSSSGGPSATPSANNVSCNGGNNGSASVSVSGGTTPYSYSWSNSGNGSAISNLTAGTYTVTITDNTSCVVTAIATVSEPTAISSSVNTTPVSCFNGNDGSVTCNASGGTGGLNYIWSNGSASSSVSPLPAGNYCVTVTDANNCSVSACQAIANPTQVTGSITPTNVSCNGGNNGSALVAASGGTGSFTYSWSNSGSSANNSSLTAGAYTVTITDGNNCTATASTAITEPTALILNADCNPTILGQSVGSANASVSGGTSPYSYNWSSGASIDTAYNLPAGIINVTVTDANNCTSTANCEVQFTSGIKETVAGISAISVFPNPTTGMLSVNLILAQASEVHLSIVDVRGALIAESRLGSTTSVNQSFDLSALAKGVYNLKITTAQGVASRKIVLN